RPENFIEDEASDFFMKSYYLLAEFRCSGRQEDIEIPRLGDAKQTGSLERLEQAYDALCSIRRLAEFGQHYCIKMLESIGDSIELKNLMVKISEIESLMKSLEKSVPLVKPLIDGWRVAKDVACEPTDDFEEMFALTEGAYRELKQNVEIVTQLL